MTNKKVLLTLAPELHERITQKARERAQTIQEYIYETLRQRVFAPPVPKSKAGRPKKVDDPYLEYFSRKR